jgi:hypothetical protein
MRTTANIRSPLFGAKHWQNVSRDARAAGLKRVRHGDVCLSSDPSACALRLTLKPNSREQLGTAALLCALRLTLKPNSRRLKPGIRTNSHPRARATTANKYRAAGDSGSTMRTTANIKTNSREQLRTAALLCALRLTLKPNSREQLGTAALLCALRLTFKPNSRRLKPGMITKQPTAAKAPRLMRELLSP